MYIQDYPHQEDKQFLLQGFSKGFKLNFAGPRTLTESKNLKSAQQHPDQIKNILDQEIKLGRMAGPYPVRPFSNLRISLIQYLKHFLSHMIKSHPSMTNLGTSAIVKKSLYNSYNHSAGY